MLYSVKLSKLPIPFAIIKSASLNSFKNSSDDSSNLTPITSLPFVITFAILSIPAIFASSSVASFSIGAPLTETTTSQ